MMIKPPNPQLMQLIVAKQGLQALQRSQGRMLLTRGATPKRLFEIASAATGKKYKRGDYASACADIQKLLDATEAVAAS